MIRLAAPGCLSVPVPDWVNPNHPSSWHAEQKGFDEVIISNAAFIDSLQPQVNLRKQQGLSVAVVDVQDVYDEFNFGPRPECLKGIH